MTCVVNPTQLRKDPTARRATVASFAAYHQTLPPVYSHYHQSQNGPTQFGHRPGYGVENAKACPELSVPQTPPPLPTLMETNAPGT